MIRRPTVIVLGAGASMPFGFPSGYGLLQKMIGNDFSRRMSIPSVPLNTPQIVAFSQSLRESGKLSVDAFLEHRRDLERIGKLAIAATLIPAEEERYLFHQSTGQPSWYARLFATMAANSLQEFCRNVVTFVTYNYDRSLEHFLFTALMASFNRTHQETFEAFSQIRIIHLHGDLGVYDPLGANKAEGRPYEPKAGWPEVEKAANRIRVIHEATEIDAAYNSAHAAIAAAGALYFIGFSYGADNLRRLLPPAVLKAGPSFISGSALGLTETEQRVVTQALRPSESFLVDADAALFLRTAQPLDVGGP